MSWLNAFHSRVRSWAAAMVMQCMGSFMFYGCFCTVQSLQCTYIGTYGTAGRKIWDFCLFCSMSPASVQWVWTIPTWKVLVQKGGHIFRIVQWWRPPHHLRFPQANNFHLVCSFIFKKSSISTVPTYRRSWPSFIHWPWCFKRYHRLSTVAPPLCIPCRVITAIHLGSNK